MRTTLKEVLPKRLHMVRSAYELTIKKAAALCENVSQSTLTAWEASSRLPTIDGLADFSETFGVSVDWLIGISNAPYTTDSVNAAEDSVGLMTPDTGGFNIFERLVVDRMRYNGDFVGDERIQQNARIYEDKKLRSETFSLEARANAVVCMRLFALNSLKKEGDGGSRRYGMKESNFLNGLKLIALTATAAFHINTDQ